MSFRLEAVNRCLKAIGEDPVNQLASGFAEADKASNKIDEVTREVLSIGWHNNTEYDVELTPDDDGNIVVPLGTDEKPSYITIDTWGSSSRIDITVRRDPNDDLLKVYNLTDNTFVFDDPIRVIIVRYFDIDDLPFALQNYIACLAARKYQDDEVGSVNADAALVRDEQRAWSMLVDEEIDVEDSNILTDNAYVRAVVGRNNTLFGY